MKAAARTRMPPGPIAHLARHDYLSVDRSNAGCAAVPPVSEASRRGAAGDISGGDHKCPSEASRLAARAEIVRQISAALTALALTAAMVTVILPAIAAMIERWPETSGMTAQPALAGSTDADSPSCPARSP